MDKKNNDGMIRPDKIEKETNVVSKKDGWVK